MFKTKPVSFKRLYPGMIIKDSTGYVGAVIKCDDIDHVLVKFDPQGYGFINLNPKHERYEKIYEKIDK